MNNITHFICFKSFFDYYSSKISPKFCDIDIYLRSGEEMNLEDVSDLLSISENELKNIMNEKNIYFIDKGNFLEIMLLGSSYICQLYRREVECGSPILYTPEQISYIFDLDIYIILQICKELDIKEASSIILPKIFSKIAVS